MNDREFKIRLNNFFFFFFYEMIAKMSGKEGGEKSKNKKRKKDKPLATGYFTFAITYIEAKITTQLDWLAEKRDIDSMELASCSSLICRCRCIHIDVVKLTKKRKRKEKKLVVEGEIGQWERRRIDVNITINTAGGSPKGASIIGYRIEVINKKQINKNLTRSRQVFNPLIPSLITR